MSRLAMILHIRPAGGRSLVGLMLAVAVASLGTASLLVPTAAHVVPAVAGAALPTAIVGLGELPLPPRCRPDEPTAAA